MLPNHSKSENSLPTDIDGPKRNWRAFFLVALSLAMVTVAYIAVDRLNMSGAMAYTVQGLMIVAEIFLIGKGADWLVEAASRLAESLGMSHLVIGLTVVAFGTSAPEAVVSIGAGLQGNGDITIANVIGSNIFNLCIILGTVAAVARHGLRIDRELFLRDGPLLLASSIVLFLFVGGLPSSVGSSGTGIGPRSLCLLNFGLERGEGAILFLGLVLYLLWLYRLARKKGRVPEFEHEREEGLGWQPKNSDSGRTSAPRRVPGASIGSTLRDFALLGGSLALVLVACHLLVGQVEAANGAVKGYGALWFAKMLGVPDYVVGLTIVAAGTSAPEFVVSLYAALKGHFGLCVGNLVGSSLFNVMGVVGLSGIILQKPLSEPVAVSPAATVNLIALIAIAAVVAFFMWSKQRITRVEGVILVLLGLGCWIRDFL